MISAVTPELRLAMKRHLTYRERSVLECIYGPGDGGHGPLSLVDTACIFRVTRERIRHLRDKAVAKLKAANCADLLP